jgi:signal transduction histidine kinase
VIWLPSLRARLLWGAVLWTAGLFAAAVLISTVILFQHPSYPRLLHNTAGAHATVFTVFAIVCMLAGAAQMRIGLSSVTRLRGRLLAVREGRDRRVEGTYPSEVQPLVDDLNALLDHREQAIARALSKAGDLAHGLKTPLAVLAREADRARAEGHAELAVAIAQQVERMRRQTEYHLAQARAVASGATPGASCHVRESSDALARTLLRLYAERGLTIRDDTTPDHAVRCQREDLDEMLGNLLDNACKWARSRVVIASARHGPSTIITIDDDGAGVPASMHESVLQRGVRADEAAPGSGLGLAIVRELAELYGGSISLQASPLGGLQARLTLPTSV